MRRRPTGDPMQVHARLIEALRSLPDPWRPREANPTLPPPGPATATMTYRGWLGTDVVAHTTYKHGREQHVGDARYDDVFSFAFAPGKPQLAPIANAVLPALVEALEPYRADVGEQGSDPRRSAQVRLGGFSPLGYYDADVVNAELGIAPADFVRRAPGWVRMFHRGVLVTMDVAPGRVGDLRHADATLRALARFG
jgi:hypothetical protein